MSLSGNKHLIETAKILCRELRKHSTNSERILWNELRNRKFDNKKFYRQYPLFFDYLGKETFFIADFYCYEERIVIEVDGGYHKRQKCYDELRTEVINLLGIQVIRFNKEEVTENLNSVLTKLNIFMNRTHP